MNSEQSDKFVSFFLYVYFCEVNKTVIMNLNDTVSYIGIDNLDSSLFESQYIIPEGISYNSYLICDEKTAIIDTVDASAGEGWKDNLIAALSGRDPDYLIIHHMEQF